eukprot:TRINITY_DN654_c1_g2_i1.p1 TRINITY_DN654_c1_g2~~TRINITY_DN654_c1_g2_i1.p1  ORF type:complete len:329 (-),score=21.09 TRINITY_DN654_c1_g2_i1:177-1031(-)
MQMYMKLLVVLLTFLQCPAQRTSSFVWGTISNGKEWQSRFQPYTKPGYCNEKCNDKPPPPGIFRRTQFSCEEQKKFGQCHANFMQGFCECTCDKCCPCNNSPPPGSRYSCTQQRLFGKCNRDWMVGYCECECGRCPALFEQQESNGGTAESAPLPIIDPSSILPPEVRGSTFAEQSTPLPIIDPSSILPPEVRGGSAFVDTIAVASDGGVVDNGGDAQLGQDKGCSDGEVPIPGSRPVKCESASCARSRNRCSDQCEGETLFECKIVVQGNSRTKSQSCACIGL